MRVQVLSETEQRLIQRGLAKLGERMADVLYGRLHPSDGSHLILVWPHDGDKETTTTPVRDKAQTHREGHKDEKPTMRHEHKPWCSKRKGYDFCTCGLN